MNKDQIFVAQTKLKELGLYDQEIDGIWGANSQAAFDALISLATLRNDAPVAETPNHGQMAWGAKVSKVFRDRIQWIAEQLKMPKSDGASWIMACIAWESGETFSASVRNMAGSGATGLIQFMPSTARGMGTTTEALARMTAEDQLRYVYRYFLPYKGRLNSLGDVYMSILWPAGIGKSDSFVLWNKDTRPTTYRQNSGLDINKDGSITRLEAVRKVGDKLEKGLYKEMIG